MTKGLWAKTESVISTRSESRGGAIYFQWEWGRQSISVVERNKTFVAWWLRSIFQCCKGELLGSARQYPGKIGTGNNHAVDDNQKILLRHRQSHDSVSQTDEYQTRRRKTSWRHQALLHRCVREPPDSNVSENKSIPRWNRHHLCLLCFMRLWRRAWTLKRDKPVAPTPFARCQPGGEAYCISF